MDIKNVDLFFHENPNPMMVYDRSTLAIKEINEAALELYGYTRGEMLGLTIADLRPQSELKKLREYFAEDPKSYDNAGVWKHQKKNGDILFVRVLTSRISVDKKEYQLSVVQDITREREYQKKFEMVYENSLDGMMLTKPSGDVLEANSAACDMLGMTEEEIIQLGREGLVVKDEKLEKALEHRAETGRFSSEVTLIHKSGRTFPAEVTSSVFTNDLGEHRTSLVIRDISDRKQMEQALRQEKELTDIIINSMPGLFFVLNQSGEFVRWNQNVETVFGLSPEQVRRTSAVNLVSEVDRDKAVLEIEKVLEKGHAQVELKVNSRGNGTSVYSYVSNRLKQNGNTYIIGSGIDITPQKELEKKISDLLKKEHKQRLQAELDRNKLEELFEKAPTPKCLLEGPEFRYVIANESYREVVGQEYIIGKKISEVIPEIADQGYMDILNSVYESGESYVGYNRPVTIDKQARDAKRNYVFNMVFQPLFDTKGEVSSIFVEAVDMSEQHEYQERLEESLKEKETLLAEIHHRVKNNLAIVSGMMELQAMESKEEALQDALNTGQQRIQTIALIHELLYESDSLSQVNFETNIKRLLDSLHEIYRGQKQISVEVESKPVVLNINQAIPCALVINEIVTNAYKHAFVGREKGNITVEMREEKGKVFIEVKDDGIGFPDDLNPQTAKTLGITLVNLLTQQLDADLEISTNNGTHFTLVFQKSDVKGSSSSFLY